MEKNIRKSQTKKQAREQAIKAAQKRLKSVSWTKIPNPENVRARIMSKVEKKNVSRRGCWEFTGSLNSRGYPLLFTALEGEPPRAHLAHRLSLALATNNMLPDSRVIMACHVVCDNPKCVNPKHLSWGDAAFNNFDRNSKGRHLGENGKPKGIAQSTHCVNGHPYDDENTRIDNKGHRSCQTCHRASVQRRAARKAAA